jgi:hypothetical protein
MLVRRLSPLQKHEVVAVQLIGLAKSENEKGRPVFFSLFSFDK